MPTDEDIKKKVKTDVAILNDKVTNVDAYHQTKKEFDLLKKAINEPVEVMFLDRKTPQTIQGKLLKVFDYGNIEIEGHGSIPFIGLFKGIRQISSIKRGVLYQYKTISYADTIHKQFKGLSLEDMSKHNLELVNKMKVEKYGTTIH